MKKINKDGVRALIIETLEEMSLGEAKKKVEEADPVHEPEPTGGYDDVPTGKEAEPNPEDFAIKTNLDQATTNQLIQSYESIIPLFLTSLKKSPNATTANVVANNLKEYAKKFEELAESGAPQQAETPLLSPK